MAFREGQGGKGQPPIRWQPMRERKVVVAGLPGAEGTTAGPWWWRRAGSRQVRSTRAQARSLLVPRSALSRLEGAYGSGADEVGQPARVLIQIPL